MVVFYIEVLIAALASITGGLWLVSTCCGGGRPQMVQKNTYPKSGGKSTDGKTVTKQPSTRSETQSMSSKLADMNGGDKKRVGGAAQNRQEPGASASEFPEKEQTTQQALSESANVSGLVSEPAKLSWKLDGGMQRIVVSNTSDERRAVKVKCSDNQLYRVNPVFSFIEPGQCISVDVIRDTGRPKVDKMVFVAAKAKPEDAKPKEVFKSGVNGPSLVLPLVVSAV